MTRVKNCQQRHKWGKFGPSFLSNKQGDLPFLLYLPKRHCQGTFKERLKKLSGNFFLLRNHLNTPKWENLNRGQHRFQPIRLCWLIAFNPFETQPHNNSIYKNIYASSTINNGGHCFLSCKTKTMHIKTLKKIKYIFLFP